MVTTTMPLKKWRRSKLLVMEKMSSPVLGMTGRRKMTLLLAWSLKPTMITILWKQQPSLRRRLLLLLLATSMMIMMTKMMIKTIVQSTSSKHLYQLTIMPPNHQLFSSHRRGGRKPTLPPILPLPTLLPLVRRLPRIPKTILL